MGARRTTRSRKPVAESWGVREGPDAQLGTRKLVPTAEILVDGPDLRSELAYPDTWRSWNFEGGRIFLSLFV